MPDLLSRKSARFALAVLVPFAVLVSMLTCRPAVAAEYQSGIQDANMRQLVIVVCFRGEEVDSADGLNAPYSYSDAYRTRWERILEGFNRWNQKITDGQSLYTYIKTVSDGQLRVETVTPQTDASTGSVAYLTLPGTRDSYISPGHVVEDAVTVFNSRYPTFDASALDLNGDSFADNVLIVPEVGNDIPDATSCLWPRAGSVGTPVFLGQGQTAVRVGSYTLVNTAQIPYVGTVIHETLHTRGAKDLYRMEGGTSVGVGEPVGVWDIMARHGSTQFMWPLAITRQDCGWTTIGEITTGEHTLYAPGSGKVQAVAFKSPLSQSEYFVVEYRKATVNPGDLFSLDASTSAAHTIGGSGLVVYRINPKAKSEWNGNKGPEDYVYIFRAGETGEGRGDGRGDLRNAQLSLSTRSRIGSTDERASLADGAITYSNGQNSGIEINVVREDADSCTFSLSFADYAQWGMWDVLVDKDGTTPFSVAASPAASMAVGAKGEVYAVLGDQIGQDCRVWQYSEGKWRNLGSRFSESVGTPSLVFHGGTLYLATQSSNMLTVRCYDGTSWRIVGSVPSAPYIVAQPMSVVGGKVAVLAAPHGGSLRLYDVREDGLVAKGEQLGADNPTNCMLFEVAGRPAVVMGENGSVFRTSISVYKDFGWDTTALSDEVGSVVSAIYANGYSYVYIYSYKNPRLYKVNLDGKVVASAQLSVLADASMGASLVAGQKGLYIAALKGVGLRSANAYSIDPASLEVSGEIGSQIYTGAGTVQLVAHGSTLYCILADLAQGTMTVRTHALPDADIAFGGEGKETGFWRTGAKGWWYEFASGGYARGWCYIDGDWYYFDSAGWMKTGWQVVDGSYYYLGASGRMATGWQKVGADWYHLGADGRMATGWLYLDDGTYFLNSSGQMATGWRLLGGSYFYFDGSGRMAVGWHKVGADWYYFRDGGYMATGWLSLPDGTYFLNSSGQMATGWRHLGGSWWFFGPSGRASVGWQHLGGSWYFFDGGRALTGWQSLGGSWFFMNSSGQVQTGWRHLGGSWYHFGPAGHMEVSRWVDGLYWVGPDGHMATSAWVDGGRYYVGADGKWVKGAVK